MRLLNVHDLTFSTFPSADVPRYIVASHRWSIGEEATLKDIKKKRNTHMSGYKKVEGYAAYIKRNIEGIDWLWIDTCCVNQDSSLEVSEAINSMFRWFSDAELCIVYLVDVVRAQDLYEFSQSSWFRRGWTLQELIAPRSIVFLTNDWQVVGCKGDGISKTGRASSPMGPPLEAILAAITGISEKVLYDGWQNNIIDTEEIFRWMAYRKTTKVEDLSYCLFGLFDVSLPIIYGEGEDKARERLIAEISKPGVPKRRSGVSSKNSPEIQSIHTNTGKQKNYSPNQSTNDLQSNVDIVNHSKDAGTDSSRGRATGVEPEAANKTVQTPLHSAARWGHDKVVDMLLKAGADSTAQSQDESGWTPMHAASFQGHIKVVKLLLEKGVNLETATKQGWTPLHCAAYNGYDQVVEVLLRAGADYAAQEQDGYTPMHAASQNGHTKVVKLLLEKGVNPETAAEHGWTPLHCAAYGGYDQVVEVLLKAGADYAAQEQDGYTPMHAASQNGHTKVVKLLLERGGNPETADNIQRLADLTNSVSSNSLRRWYTFLRTRKHK